MHKAIAVTAILAAATSTAACSQSRAEDGGPVVSRTYPVGNFSEIELAGRYDADVRTGANASVTARGPQELMDRLVVEVRGDKLLIHPKDEHRWFGGHGWKSKEKVQVTVTVPALRAATLAGSGGLNIDKVQGDRFDGQIAGSGDLRIGSVEVSSLELGIAGSGGVDAGSGRAREAHYDIAGSGDVRAQSIASETLKVSIAGSGGVKAHATRAADVDIMGSGDVEVTGGAKCSVSKAGSGNVRCS